MSVYERYTEANLMTKTYWRESVLRNTSKLINYFPDMVANIEELQHPENVELLVGSPWQVYRVSPLWGIPILSSPNVDPGHRKYDERGLKRLARAMMDIVGPDIEVEIVPFTGIRGTRFDDEALCVSVSSKIETKKVKIFTGILCSVEAIELRLKTEGATNLPMMLTKGSLDITERVVLGLEQCFDCVVGRLELPVKELQWMAAMWAGVGEGDPEKGSNKRRTTLGDNSINDGSRETTDHSGSEDKSGANVIKLIYDLPADLKKKIEGKIHHFTFEFPTEHIQEIWRCCRESEDGKEFSETEMNAFHKTINEHIRQTMGVRLDKLELVQVQLPLLRVHRGGRVAFGAVKQVKTVLRYLTELCQGDLVEAAPTLSLTGTEDCDSISMDYTLSG